MSLLSCPQESIEKIHCNELTNSCLTHTRSAMWISGKFCGILFD